MQTRQHSFGLIHQEIRTATPVQFAQRTVTPVTRVLRVDFPGRHGGVIWNRPIGILIREGGRDEVRWAPIIDVTRRAQFAIWGGVGMVLLAVWFISRRRSA